MSWRDDEARRIAEDRESRDAAREKTEAALTAEDRAWIRRLQRLEKNMPESLFVLAGRCGGLTVYKGATEPGREVARLHAVRFGQTKD
jgi:hypothetical protein